MARQVDLLRFAKLLHGCDLMEAIPVGKITQQICLYGDHFPPAGPCLVEQLMHPREALVVAEQTDVTGPLAQQPGHRVAVPGCTLCCASFKVLVASSRSRPLWPFGANDAFM